MQEKLAVAHASTAPQGAPAPEREEKVGPKPAFEQQDIPRMLEILDKRMNRLLTSSLAACVHCGLCTEACHYYASTGNPEFAPAYKADLLRKVYKRRYDWLGRVLPHWVGGKDLTPELAEKMYDLIFGACTVCRRCSFNCPMGVDYASIMATARYMMAAVNRLPEGLKATIDVHLETGNNMGISEEELIETLEWIQEELQAELDDPEAKIPLNQKGAKYFLTMNPREPKYYPLTIQAEAKILYAAKESYTISTKYWDATNYCLFIGDGANGKKVAQWQVEDVEGLGCEYLLAAECGHGYRSIRWEAANWLGREPGFKVIGFQELLAQYIQEGRIRLDKSRNPKRVTYHDPCNAAKSGGIIEEPRVVLRAAVEDFVELRHNRQYSYCCGGGGGALTMTEFAKRRMEAAKVKAEEIAETGAKIVATSCHNCLDQLAEINRHYKLGVEIKLLCELVADALVLP
ncbi:MAG: (Fe-S)-binding protein [Thermodesulfobacteriota bacterium]